MFQYLRKDLSQKIELFFQNGNKSEAKYSHSLPQTKSERQYVNQNTFELLHGDPTVNRDY